jgi:5-formyltetrahydrofolate cyclo-ligase
VIKSDLRKQYLAERKKLSAEELNHLSQRICERFCAWVLEQDHWWDSIRTIHCFLPIRKQGEIDTYQIIEALHLLYPQIRIVVSKTDPVALSMEHFVWNEALRLEENTWGIPEPVAGEPFPVDQIDLVLVPLVAFDQSGHRVGYGKGYYDRFLATCRIDTLKIGLSLFEPVPALTDTHEWDILLDYCVTPDKVWILG